MFPEWESPLYSHSNFSLLISTREMSILATRFDPELVPPATLDMLALRVVTDRSLAGPSRRSRDLVLASARRVCQGHYGPYAERVAELALAEFARTAAVSS